MKTITANRPLVRNTWLLEHRANTYSQSGEDGVLRQVLHLLTNRDRWCVDVGASDGRRFSNTRRLIEEDGYQAVLIESDRLTFKQLCRNSPTTVNIHRAAGSGAEDNLDVILKETPVPYAFDLLSIDIDGQDFHVWHAMKAYRPKVVCIEFNPTMPPSLEFIQDSDPRAPVTGSSLDALTLLAKQKGYELVAVLSFNAIFVDREYYRLYGIANNDPVVLRQDYRFLTYLFQSYEGHIYLYGNLRMPWHNLPLESRLMQHLPRFLRRYPGHYGLIHFWLLSVLRFWREKRAWK